MFPILFVLLLCLLAAAVLGVAGGHFLWTNRTSESAPHAESIRGEMGRARDASPTGRAVQVGNKKKTGWAQGLAKVQEPSESGKDIAGDIDCSISAETGLTNKVSLANLVNNDLIEVIIDGNRGDAAVSTGKGEYTAALGAAPTAGEEEVIDEQEAEDGEKLSEGIESIVGVRASRETLKETVSPSKSGDDSRKSQIVALKVLVAKTMAVTENDRRAVRHCQQEELKLKKTVLRKGSSNNVQRAAKASSDLEVARRKFTKSSNALQKATRGLKGKIDEAKERKKESRLQRK